MSKKKTHAEFIEQVRGRDFEVISDYQNNRSRIKFRCDIDGYEWEATPGNILRGTGCPECGRKIIGEKLRGTNKILENYTNWLLVDISTPTHSSATMKVDKDVWEKYDGARVFAVKNESKYIYANHNYEGSVRRFHHLVLPLKDGFEVDHHNHGDMCCIDNRLSNLRLSTSSQNSMNKSIHSNNTSGVTGVSWYKATGKWRALIRINGKQKTLGYFDNIDIAIGVRQQAEREFYGEYAYVSNRAVEA